MAASHRDIMGCPGSFDNSRLMLNLMLICADASRHPEQGEPVKNSDFFHEGSKSVEHLAGLIASLVMEDDCLKPLARGVPTEAS